MPLIVAAERKILWLWQRVLHPIFIWLGRFELFAASNLIGLLSFVLALYVVWDGRADGERADRQAKAAEDLASAARTQAEIARREFKLRVSPNVNIAVTEVGLHNGRPGAGFIVTNKGNYTLEPVEAEGTGGYGPLSAIANVWDFSTGGITRIRLVPGEPYPIGSRVKKDIVETPLMAKWTQRQFVEVHAVRLTFSDALGGRHVVEECIFRLYADTLPYRYCRNGLPNAPALHLSS